MARSDEGLIEGSFRFHYGAKTEDEPNWTLFVEKLKLAPRSFYSLIGPNMSGKTTLLRILSGQPIEEGCYEGAPLTGTLVRRGRSLLTLSDATPKGAALITHDDPMFPDLSLWDNVRLARPHGRGSFPGTAEQRFKIFLTNNPILNDRSLSTPLHDLSSGGKAFIRLARAFVWSAKLLLIDEVTANLDSDNSEWVLRAILPFLADGSAVVLVSHTARDHDQAKKFVREGNYAYSCLRLVVQEKKTCLCGE